MSPEEVNTATATLTKAVQDSATNTGTEVNTQAGQLAAGLATGSNAPGGYNYGRTIAPVVAPLQDNMVLAAKQAVFKQALKDAQYVAKTKYEDANYGYKQRQRDYTKKKALEAAARQAKYDAQSDAAYARSMSGGGGGGGGGSAGAGIAGVTGVTASGNANFIGNDDYRGRLAFAAKNGNAAAAAALKVVGNDGKYYIQNPSAQQIATLASVGATNAWVAPKAGGGGGGGGW